MPVDELTAAFEESGYEIAEASRNRDRVRIAVLDDGAEADELRSVLYSVLDESAVLGLDVTTESSDAEADMTTVVSFQYRG